MTLVEVLVAACIVMLAFLLAMGAILNMSQANQLSEDRARAVSTASSVAEELQSMTFDEALSYQPPDTGGRGTGVAVVCFDEQGNTHPLPLDPEELETPLPNPLEFQVTVFWRDKVGRPYSSRVSTFVRR